MGRFTINNLDYEKRKKIKLIAIIALIVVLNALLIWVFATNSGNEETALTDISEHQTEVPDGYTAIYNVDGLKAMSLSGKYILMSDIDLTGTTWDVIGTSSSSAFTGTLDGNNYIISNMNIDSSNQYVGMFGYTKGATIKNLILENITVKSTYTSTSASNYGYVGGVVGCATGTSTQTTKIENVGIIGQSEVENVNPGSNGTYIGGLVGDVGNTTTIINAYSTGEVIGNSTSGTICAGGLAGFVTNLSTISSAYSTGEVMATSTTGTINAGGLVGRIYGTTENSYSTGKVIGNSTSGAIHAGGLVGQTGYYYKPTNGTGTIYTAKLTNTYAIGKVSVETSGTTNMGGLIGNNVRSTVTNSYWSPETTGVNKSATIGEKAKFLQEMIHANIYIDWIFGADWKIDEESSLPYLIGMPKPDSVNASNYTYLTYEGNGTEDNPYIIRTAEQLQGVQNVLDAHYKLGNNIDVSGIANFEPIGNYEAPFIGILDGAGYTISNMNIDSSSQYVGMFGYTNGATIKNLTLENITVKSIYTSTSITNGYVGGLVGYTIGTSTLKTIIENVGIIGESRVENVNPESNYVYIGGLVGDAYQYTTITNAYSNAEVTGNSTTKAMYAGGLVGRANQYITITNAYSTGKVLVNSTSGAIYAGGLVGGESYTGIKITNTYAVGKINVETNGTKSIGGLIGYKSTSATSSTVTSSYWSTETTGVYRSATTGEKAKLLEEMTYQATYDGWFDAENSPWAIDEGSSLPYFAGMPKPSSIYANNYTYLTYEGEGTANNPFIITNAEQLQGIKNSLDAHYKLGNNIDVSGIENFEPIGNATYPFTGTLDGAGFTISNITINSSEQNVGMFGYTSGATIKNLILKDINVKSTYYLASSTAFVGGLVGYANNNTLIEGIEILELSRVEYITELNSTNYTYARIGGIVGSLDNSTLNKIANFANVNGNSKSTSIHVGGIAGYIVGASNSKLSNVTNAYSIGKVIANSGSGNIYVGGLVGYSGSYATITNTYAVGKVSAETRGTKNAGGLIGSGSPTTTASYWSPKRTKQETSKVGEAKTIQELLHQTTYEGWFDSEDSPWSIDEGTSVAYLKDFAKPEGIEEEDLDFETRVRVYVKDETGKVLENAEFVVKNEAGETVRTGVTNSKGIYNILDLEPGIYTVEETKAPVSYIKDTTVRTFKLSEEGYTVDAETNEEITIELVNLPYEIQLRNLEKDTNKPIKGAVIGLFDDAGKAVTGVDGKVIRGTTDDDGNVVLTKMPYGTYKYKQTVAKLGYAIDETEYTLTIAEDGTVTFGQDNAGVIYNEKVKTNITVHKVWNDNDNLRGKRPDSVQIKLFANGTEVDSVVISEAENWEHTFTVDKYNDNSVQINYTISEGAVNEGDLKFYTATIRENTVTNTYIIPSNIPYKVEHYKQNDTLDGYYLAETENLTGTLDRVVIAVPKDYDGYILNANATGTVQKGVIAEDGSLVLKLYYDKLKVENFNVNISNIETGTSEPIANTEYDVLIKYSDGSEVKYLGQKTNEAGNILIENVVGKSITKICFTQTKMAEGHKANSEQQYVEVKVDAITGKLNLTGAQSADIIAGIEDKTVYITQVNNKLNYSNKLRINVIDSEDNTIRFGDVSFEFMLPTEGIKTITTNEEGTAEIANLSVPGIGDYPYLFRELNGSTWWALEITYDENGKIISTAGDGRYSDEIEFKHSIIKETTDTEEVTVVNIDMIITRKPNETFSDYTLKVIETDKDTNSLVSGVKYEVKQKAKINEKYTTLNSTKTTNVNGEAVFDVANASEITFTIKRTDAPSEYKLIKDEIEVKVRYNNGEYELVEEVPGVTIDTENNEIIVNRSIYTKDSQYNEARKRINNTIYITKVDDYYRPIEGVDLVLSAYKCGDEGEIDKNSPIAVWDLTTNKVGLAEINSFEIIEALGEKFPELLVEGEGTIQFWISEITVPYGYTGPQDDIGFEVQYKFSEKGNLEIVTMNVLDGTSYQHIVDQSYDQYEAEKYIQADIRLKVINPHAEVTKNILQIEKVDSENKDLKLPNATFNVTFTYPEVTLSNGKTKVYKTSTKGKTGADGLITIPNLIFPEGTTKVEIQELSAPSGYVLNPIKFRLDITNKGGLISVGEEYIDMDGEVIITVTAENVKKEIAKPYNIVIQKRDSNSQGLVYTTAKFDVNVTCDETTTNYSTTTKNGKATISGLNGKGTISIEVKETEAPLGYKLNEEVKVININKESLLSEIELREAYDNVKISNNTIIIDVYDEPNDQIPLLQIKKVDSKNTKLGLEKASFKVTMPGENGETRTISTMKDGLANIVLTNAVSGRYIIEETKAPSGYNIAKKVALDITFDENKNITSSDIVSGLGEEYVDTVVSKSVSGKRVNITIADEKIEVPISKTYGVHIDKVSSTNSNIKLNNAYFDLKIEEENGLNYSVTLKTDHNKGAYVPNLTGTGKIKVLLQEISAPSGYIKNPDLQELIFTRDEQTQELVLDTGSLVNIDESDITIDNINHIIHIRVKNTPEDETEEPDPLPDDGIGPGESKDYNWSNGGTGGSGSGSGGSGGTGGSGSGSGGAGGITQKPKGDSPLKKEPVEIETFRIRLEKVNSNNEKIKVVGAKYAIYVLNEETNEQTVEIENTGKDGKIYLSGFKGYGDFTITIVEINAPKGYAIDEYVHTIKIHRDNKTGLITIRQTDLGNNAEVKIDDINSVVNVKISEKSNTLGLAIYKQDSKDEELGIKNVEFKIIDNETEEEYNLTTGEEGMEFISLPVKTNGTHMFTITEISTIEGYKMQTAPIKLKVQYENGLIVGAEAIPTSIQDSIKMTKRTSEYIELSILNKKETYEEKYMYDIELIKGDAYYPNITFADAQIKVEVDNEIGVKNLTKTALTDEEGKIYINDIYGLGKVDIDITELVPPTGRRFDTKTKAVRLIVDKETGEIRLDKQTSNVDTFIDNENRKITIRVRNYPDGTFVIGANKVDIDDKDLILTGAEYSIQLEGSSEIYYTKENIEGLLTISEIPMPMPLSSGTYTYIIRETKAPLGYGLNSTEIRLKIEVTNDNGIATITKAQVESGSGEVAIYGDEFLHLRLMNHKIEDGEETNKYTITLTKVDAKVGEQILKNATIGIQVKAESGEQYYKEVKTNEYGQINLNDIKGTGRVEVTVTETEAPESYIKEGKAKTIIFTRDPNTKEITLEPSNDEFITVEENEGNVNVILKNTLDLSKAQYVTIRKVIKDKDTGLAGATIVLNDESGKELQRRKTNEEGYVTFIAELGKTYYYKEIEAPVGYTLNETEYSFNALEDGTIEDIVGNRVIENTKVTMKESFTITKKEAETENILSGAVIGIFDAEGNEIIKKVTGEDGTVAISKLEVGDYYYKEITPPSGYILNETEYHFTVENDGTVTFAENATGTIYNEIGTITIEVHKVWVDTEGQTAKRPANIVVQVKNGEAIAADKTVSNTTEDIVFENLPKYDESGNKINYTVEEVEENEGDLKYYVSSITKNADGTYTITNTFTVPEELLKVTIKKVDESTLEGLAGAVIELISEDGTKVEKTTDSNGYVTFEGLTSSKTYTYIEKTPPTGYSLNLNEYSFKVNELGEIEDIVGNRIIENELELWNSRITIEVHKVWVDTEGQIVKRPANIVIQIKNGNTVVASKKVSNTTQTITFENLPKYDENKVEIIYVAEEVEENKDDLKYYVPTITGDATNGFTITNTFTIPEEMLKVTIKKVDESTLEGLAGAVIELISEDGTKVEGTTGNDGYVTFEGLTPSKTYTYKEKTPPTGYSLNTDEYSFKVNKLGEIEDITGNRIIKNELEKWNSKITIEVHKVWVDTEGQIVKRPANIVVQVKNGETIVASKTISNTTESVVFEDLPQYDADRNKINYTVEEVEENEGNLRYYVSSITKNADGTYTITNTFTVPEEMLKVTIKKVDETTLVGLPGAVIELIPEDGTKVEKTTDNDGYVTFEGLNPSKTYTYKEKTPPTGYSLNTNEYSFKINELGEIEDIAGNRIIENELEKWNSKITIEVHKVWVDTEGQIVKRPANIVVQVKNGETVVASKTISNTTESVVFENLPQYDADRNEINYTVEEVEEHDGDLRYYVSAIVKNADGTYTITNTFTIPEELLKVTIRKIDAITKEGLKGATITIIDESGNEVSSVTDDDGYVTFEGLTPSKTYTYKEKTPPTGYSLNTNEYSFKINELGEIEDIAGNRIIENELEKWNNRITIEVHKVWVDTEGQIVKRPANIVIRVKNGETIVASKTISNTTESVVFENLPQYDADRNEINYTVEEVEEHDGDLRYYVSAIVKNADGTYTITNTFTIPEELLKVTIRKIDAITKEGLKGATITIIDESGNEVSSVTDDDGYVTFEGLTPSKTYTYKEKTPPTGYTLNTNEYSFRINELGEIEDIVGNRIIENSRVVMIEELTITKMRYGTEIRLPGAIIGIFDNEGNEIERKTTNENGTVTFIGLEPGKYYYKEIKAPTGYKLNNTEYHFEVTDKGIIANEENAQRIIYNELIPEEIKIDVPIYKADILTKELLSGARIGLYDEAGNLIEEKITEEGRVVFNGLIAGKTYKYKEVTSPAGYVLNDTVYSFRITKDGTIEYLGDTIQIDGVKYIVIYNEAVKIPEEIKVDVPIYKADILTKELLSGAKIGLYDENGTVIAEKITADGRVVFSGLIAGKTYRYKEIIAPTGYVLNNTVYSFKIAKDGTIEYLGDTIQIDGVKYIVIYNDPLRIDVPIYKKDILTEELLSGAVIGLYDASGKAIEVNNKVVVATTDETGKAVFSGLKPGMIYQYKEEKAPVGYEINSTMYAFRIKEDGSIVYDSAKGIIYDTKIVQIPEIPTPPNTDTKLPQTGINAIVLGTLMMLTGVSVCGTIYYRRKIK